MEHGAVFVHVNIVARKWKELAAFYTEVFDCVPQYPERDLAGQWLDDATGIGNSRIRGIHLRLPGRTDGPTLEIFQYDDEPARPPNRINSPGIAHLAFQVDDVEWYAERVLDKGGSRVGKITRRDIESVGTIVFIYCRDPEGNIIELQNWTRRV